MSKTHDPTKDGCDHPCLTCTQARETRANGYYVWVQCEHLNTVRSH